MGLGSVTDENGADIRVHADVSPGAEIAVYVASIDGDFVYSGSLATGATDVDLSIGTVRAATSIQLVGIKGQATVDAFEALQTTCTN